MNLEKLLQDLQTTKPEYWSVGNEKSPALDVSCFPYTCQTTILNDHPLHLLYNLELPHLKIYQPDLPKPNRDIVMGSLTPRYINLINTLFPKPENGN